jgi:hypothetical protein
VAELIRARESGQGDWFRSEKEYAAADIGVSSGGRSMGGLRLWKVLVTELKPLLGSTEEFSWSMRNNETVRGLWKTIDCDHENLVSFELCSLRDNTQSTVFYLVNFVPFGHVMLREIIVLTRTRQEN